MESVLNLYNDSDKVDEKAKSKLNELLLLLKMLHGNIYKISTARNYFIKQYMEDDSSSYNPTLKRINTMYMSNDDLDYSNYQDRSGFSGKTP